MTEDPVDVLRRLVECWDRHDADGAAALLAEEVLYRDVTLPAPFRSRRAVRRFYRAFFATFPDVRVELLTAFGAGRQAVAEWVMEGCQEGDLPDLPATGRRVRIQGASVSVVAGGKIQRQVDYWDAATMKGQLRAEASPAT